MDRRIGKDAVLIFIKKYKYAVVVLLLGIVLMLLPSASQEDSAEIRDPPAASEITETDEARLAKILSQIEGAGKVQVLLTQGRGEEVIYQTNDETSTGESAGNIRIETVIVSNGSREEEGLIRQVNPPTYLGAIIVCEGGDRPAVRLAISVAVSDVTGLGSDRISVLKMK